MAQPQALELSRKEVGRLPRNADLEAALDKAIAVTAIQFSALRDYDKELGTALSLCGRPVLVLMSEGDQPLLPLPAFVSRHDPSDREPGFVLTLQDRAIVAWTEGTLRLRYFAQVIPYSSVRAATYQLLTGRHSGIVQVEADDVWTFRIRTMFKDQSIIQAMTNSFLANTGAHG